MDFWRFLLTPEKIQRLLKEKSIRIKERNPVEARSYVNAAEKIAHFTLTLAPTEENATMIFRELYECIRQLGDALWLLKGYESQTHDATLALLKELEIPHKVKLHFLDRYNIIRHDANYRGILASVDQAKEIIEFWKECSSEIIHLIDEKLKEKPLFKQSGVIFK